MSRVAAILIALVLIALVTAAAWAGNGGDTDPGEIRIVVRETPATVRLRILPPEAVEPGSVEIQLAGREVTVLARATSGRTIRSHPLRLGGPVVEEAARADYEADGTLTVTLHKRRPSPS